jgi:cobalt-zinc-cadmium efflux system protein
VSAERANAGTAATLRVALVLTLAIAVLELVGGFMAHSLALLSDAAHVFMDAFALGIAAVANAEAVRRPATLRQTFGFARLEVLAALANGGLLFAITVLIVIEAVRRLASPEIPQGGLMALVATIGFVTNVAIGWALLRAARENINVRAALFHIASDALGGLAVALGGLLILAGKIAWLDPVLSLFVAVIIVVGVVRIVREAADVLLESTPSHAEVPAVRERIRALAGVVDVHDLHVWTLGPGSHALSAHILVADSSVSEASALLRRIDERMRSEFGITHVTLQFECEACAADERIVCTQIAPT